MAVVSHKHRYLFILNPRTGCTALANGVLLPHLAGQWLPEQDIPGAVMKHTTMQQLRDTELLNGVASYTVFGGIRNPFDSLVSLYTKIIKRYHKEIQNTDSHFYLRNVRAREEADVAVHQGFNAWIKVKYSRALQREPIHFHAKWIEGVEFFLRFEHLKEDWRRLCADLSIPYIEIPVMNKTGRDSDYRSFYDNESRAMIEQIFAPTLDRFDYEF